MEGREGVERANQREGREGESEEKARDKAPVEVGLQCGVGGGERERAKRE